MERDEIIHRLRMLAAKKRNQAEVNSHKDATQYAQGAASAQAVVSDEIEAIIELIYPPRYSSRFIATPLEKEVIKLSHDDRKNTQQEYKRWERGTQKLQGSGVHVARLIALKGAVKLEGLGMKRRGKSATAIVRDMFELKQGVSREELLSRLDSEIAEFASDAIMAKSKSALETR